MDIRQEVAYLKRYYKTEKPFEIIKAKNIIVLYEDLGCINGYYNLAIRQKQIHLNHNLGRHHITYTATHELAHAIIHPKANTPFLLANTYQSVNKLEIEANTFAMELLVSDEILYEYVYVQEYSLEQLSHVLGYYEELIRLRLK